MSPIDVTTVRDGWSGSLPAPGTSSPRPPVPWKVSFGFSRRRVSSLPSGRRRQTNRSPSARLSESCFLSSTRTETLALTCSISNRRPSGAPLFPGRDWSQK